MVNVFRADLAVGLAGCVMYLLALGLQTYVARAPLDFLDGEQNVFHIGDDDCEFIRGCVLRRLGHWSNMRSLTMSLVYEKALKLSSSA
ncbi:hypothetical protein PR003_g29005 [Phytophthora rubi]|uniref:Uncharacterized protein n=1 Tax=Phytophthora rubi TaxID=129364 RepID=A0A6A3H9B9_9STRA|nr:hypothetical protein PR001_g28457 [Phytophthora rubi]KAE9276656.1 hypothetical protein PR003_g29005 [Phytophthora rubi]